MPPPAPTDVIATTTGDEQSGRVVHLRWRPAPGTNAVYRIYDDAMGAGPGSDTCRVETIGRPPVVVTSPNATRADVGPYGGCTGCGKLCLWVAAANSAGESSWVLARGDIPIY